MLNLLFLLVQFPNNHSLKLKTVQLHYIAELSCTSDLFDNLCLTQQSYFLLRHFGPKTFIRQYLCARIVLPDEGLPTETLQKKKGLLGQVKIVEQIACARKFCNIMLNLLC